MEYGFIIVRMMGGLGNQMFQAALVEELNTIGRNVKIDISEWEQYNVSNHNGYELDRVFGLNYDVASYGDISKYIYSNHSFKEKVLCHIFGQKKKYYKESEAFNREVLKDISEGYLMGYWQNEKYFYNVRDRIREIFTFRNIEHYDIEDRISECESVGVHVRRGDYLKYEEKYGGICNAYYYRDSIEYVKKRVPQAKFFIFSDDEEYAKKLFCDENMEVVEGNKGVKSYYDMYYMSKCKHNIVANSTFSWWGAYLNSNPDKIVIRPERFDNTTMKDIYPASWIVIRNKNE